MSSEQRFIELENSPNRARPNPEDAKNDMEAATEQTQALARLLRDADPQTTALLREHISDAPSEWMPRLAELSLDPDYRVALNARTLLHQASREDAAEDFDLLCHFFPEHGNLEEACWVLGKALDPCADIATARRKVNAWGRSLLLKIAGAVSNRQRVRILADFMARDLCFRGNAEDYYNPRNSFLHSVIESRAGLPILLSCLAIFISHRAGMNVVGINMPGHFLARHGEVIFDPFHRGKILTHADCVDILRCQGLDESHLDLQPATPLQILRRVLANLLHVHRRRGDLDAAGQIESWLHALHR